MGRIKFLFVVVLSIFLSCSKNPAAYVNHIEGYWQIHTVEQNRTMIKEYNVTGAIDYFKINEDGSGFRKKVTPTMDGNLLVSDHLVPFIYKIEQDSLNIYYQGDETEYMETIKTADSTQMIITNARGFRYTYIPYPILKSQE